MREINVTVIGNVGADPLTRETSNGRVTNFTLGSSPRVRDRASGEWVDGPTTWFRVACWRELGANVAESIRKGERVIVAGRLKVSSYEDRDGGERTSVELVAEHVGHELTFGTTRFTRVVRSAALDDPDDSGLSDPLDAPDLYDPGTGEILDDEPVPV